MEIIQGILVVVGFAVTVVTFLSWKSWSAFKHDQRIREFRINELVKQSKERLDTIITCIGCRGLLIENNSYKVRVNSCGVCFTENYCNACKPEYEEKVITPSVDSAFCYKYFKKIKVDINGEPIGYKK